MVHCSGNEAIFILLTKECDYGVRVIRALADGEKRNVATICTAELVPMPYAYKILKKLAHAGLLQVRRGKNGGYFLAKPLSTITLYDIVTAVDENLLIFECLSDQNHCSLHQPDAPCNVHLEFNRLQSQLVAEMQAKTMDEIFQLPPPTASN